MTTKTMLVAHDFSEPANRALILAADIARALGATVHIVHVHPEIYDGHSDPALGLPWPTPGQEERYLRFLETEVQRSAFAALGEESKRAKCHVLRGNPVKRLTAFALELNADILCIGSTGKGAIERVLLGSVSQQILRTSPVPVLTVP